VIGVEACFGDVEARFGDVEARFGDVDIIYKYINIFIFFTIKTKSNPIQQYK
jgi:Holliday junction resolvase-like predicted endonuclease